MTAFGDYWKKKPHMTALEAIEFCRHHFGMHDEVRDALNMATAALSAPDLREAIAALPEMVGEPNEDGRSLVRRSDALTVLHKSMPYAEMWARNCEWIGEVLDAADKAENASAAEVIVALRKQGAGLAQHTDSSDCWCHPRRSSVDPVTGAEVWVHGGAS